MWWWIGCGTVEQLLPLVGPETTVPPSVRALLPIPNDARIEDEGCIGRAGREGHTCTVQLIAPLPPGPAAEGAAHAMAAWTETSWDEVPGRIQYSWTRGPEQIGIAVFPHELGSKWSVHYTWTARSMPATAPPLPPLAYEGPSAPIPAPLAALPVPEGATLIGSDPDPARFGPSAQWAFMSDPDPWIERIAALPGARVTLHSRTPVSRALMLDGADSELSLIVYLAPAAGQPHRLVATARPRQAGRP